MTDDRFESIRTYLDEDGRVILWPAKKWIERRNLVLEYLAEKFELNRSYSEIEVNVILKRWLIFGDHALMRRELADTGKMVRSRDGTAYRRVERP